MIATVTIAFVSVPVGIPAESPRARELKDNIEVKLVGWKTSVARTQHKIAVFETLEKEPRRLELHFGPTGRYTPQRATLEALIMGVTEATKGEAGSGWTRAGVEAVFSTPDPDKRGRKINDYFEHTCLVRLTIVNGK